jgi:PAS domain S-box-containing protein
LDSISGEGPRDEAQILSELNRLGSALASEHDLERAVQVVTDAATRLTGAAFGSFFYNVVNDQGESYLLYALSGASREAFAGFPMPRNTDIFAPTFAGEATVRSANITRDPRFGKNPPYHGHPRGHLPVVSYLATPVISRTGEVLGGLFFGHQGEGVFDARAERIVEAIAVQAATAIDKARLYQALVRSEQSLEQKVQERTLELADANERLRHEIAEREHAEGRFQLLVEGVSDYAVFMLDPTGIVTNWNTGAQRIKGYRAAEIVGRHFENFYTEEDRAAGVPRRALETARREGKFEAEGQRVRKDGSRFWASVVINRINDRTGNLVGFAKITRDITERRQAQENLQRAQEQLAQAQKMEGIGQLTGGVAHDFNNLLTVIMGNLETAQRAGRTANPDRLNHALHQAMQGAQRAAALTQRLLAFSRRSPLDPKPIDANRLVVGMSDMLRRTLGEQVTIETVLGGGLWQIHADPNQLEVSIVNLAVNARDAMPQGGRLTIETANAYLDEAYAASQSEVVPGQYVVISITDTGVGMSRETLGHALEPFFTTKDIGHGTGLGLSQVYGFTKQSGGHLRIYSELGHGTTVKLYLPRLLSSGEPDVVSPDLPTQAPASASGETILVVEDDPDVRANTTGMLRELHYNVLEASLGAAALRLIEGHSEIDLLFTDVGLPGGMNGRQLADAVHRIRPDLRVLFTTGYARNAIVHGGRLDPGVQLLPKPFTYAGLASRLAEILGSKSAEPRVLLVEDEILVQMLVKEQLSSLGCKVEVAGSLAQAMNTAKLLDGNLDIAIVDIGLPDGKGDLLTAELRALYPRLPIVIASGYDEESLRARFKSDPWIRFLRKPYTLDDLRGVIDALPGRGARTA